MSSVTPRDYYADISREDQENIKFILGTMTGCSPFSRRVLTGESRLRQAGDEAKDRVHPLKYLKYIMSDETLKGQFQNIHGSLWNMMKNGFVASLNEAAKNNNLDDKMAQDFCEISSSLDSNKVTQLFQKQDWKQFLSYIHHA